LRNTRSPLACHDKAFGDLTDLLGCDRRKVCAGGEQHRVQQRRPRRAAVIEYGLPDTIWC
jgi:hypothetical protein